MILTRVEEAHSKNSFHMF